MHDDDPQSVPFSDALAELALFALEHGVRSVDEGGPLVPFVVIEQGKGPEVRQFMAPTVEESLEQARAYAAAAIGGRVVIAYEGYLQTPEGEKYDAIYAQAFEDGEPNSHVFAQCYEPGGEGKAFGLIDEPVYCAEEEPLF